jgi:hypothetical protein
MSLSTQIYEKQFYSTTGSKKRAKTNEADWKSALPWALRSVFRGVLLKMCAQRNGGAFGLRLSSAAF